MPILRVIFFLSVYCLLNYVSIAQTGMLTGHLIVDKYADKDRIAKSTLVILRDSERKIALLDKDLNFFFDSLYTDTIQLRLEGMLNYPDTTIENLVVEDGNTTHLEIPWPMICKYDKSKKDKTCPVCKKKDETIPIVYGLLVDTGKKTKKKQKEFYPGGCVISGCDPNWYCKRDKIEF